MLRHLDQDAALEQFEEARTLLHGLGDRHWECKVLGNVGMAKHRVGRDDEAVDLLRSALAKLTPEGDAYPGRRTAARSTGLEPAVYEHDAQASA